MDEGYFEARDILRGTLVSYNQCGKIITKILIPLYTIIIVSEIRVYAIYLYVDMNFHTT